MTDKLPYAASLAVLAAIVLGGIAIEDGWTWRVGVTAGLYVAICALLAFLYALGRAGTDASRHEARWDANGEGPWHRKEGDPR